ncbi:uncharacterized protein [Haliotis asinina]|uniref:uncharacterized protein n=1 Tax=Haliotis asinina TaxID=109174 RepID=UPI0035321BEE
MKPHAEYQFKKALSAMRNSGGGTLFVHVCDDISKGENTFRTTVVPVLESLLTDDETMSDAFSWRSLESRQGQVYKIEVLPSDTFIPVDVKTKLSGWCRDKHVSASFQKLRPLLLFPRNVSTAEPTVQGLTRINQVDAVKIYVDNIPWYYSLHAPFHASSALVNAIIDDHSLPEYVTSVSKRKQGGSVYVGQRRYDKTDDMSGVPYPMEWGKYGLQSMLADRLQKEIFIFKNRHSNVVLKTKDVFQIEIHDTGPNSGIIEVAVRPVDGCVFTDALGPVSFRIENKSLGEHHYKAFVRLSIDEWMETASG